MDEQRKEWYVRYFIKLCKPCHSLNGTVENGGTGTESAIVEISMVGTVRSALLHDKVVLCTSHFTGFIARVEGFFVLSQNFL